MPHTFHRRHLPHLYDYEGTYFVTFRLADSIPQILLSRKNHQRKKTTFEIFKREFCICDEMLDKRKFGSNYLIRKDIAEVCKSAIHYPDGKDYKLICYTIMPNHVHLVFSLIPGNKGISKITQGIKGVSGRKSNKELNLSGKFWQDESYDRWVRNDTELYFVIRYVLMNPVEAGLVVNWYDWEHTFCSPEYVVI